jgi:putative ABC transport system permease protein
VSGLGHAVFLAIAYLRSAPVRTGVLILGTTLALFLPTLTWTAAGYIEDELLSRADASPVLLGRKGNEFDLTMSSLYFRGQVRDTVEYGVRDRVLERDYGLAIPLHVVHSAGGAPVVGTSLEYFEQRGLRLADGRKPALLAEAVAGAGVVRDFDLSVGDTVRSDLSNLYNLAGPYPILLQVVGTLEPTGTSDDEAFFVDVKTTWLLDGYLHGHEEVTAETALNTQGEQTEQAEQPPSNLEASPAVFMFAEIDTSNRDSFHLHGGAEGMPVSSILVFPKDVRAYDQLLGDFVLDDVYQAVEPSTVITTILGIVLRLRDGLTAYFGLVAFSTACFFVLVLSLSLRLRAAEIRLMKRIGCSRSTIASVVGVEVAIILAASAASTGALTWAGLTFVRAGLGG